MSKKTQLVFFVILFFIIIIVLWFFINFKNRNISFGLGEDFNGLKNDISNNIKEIQVQGDIKNAIEKMKNLIQSEQEAKEQEANDFKKQIAQKVVEKISTPTSTINIVSYQDDRWKVGFDYDEAMKKEMDSKKETIFLYYENQKDSNLTIKKQKLGNVTFDNWLNKNNNLQDLEKQNFNGLSFWSKDIKNDKLKIKEYYLNIDKDLYIFRLENLLGKDELWKNLTSIVESFKKL